LPKPPDLSGAAPDSSPADEALRFLERVFKIVRGGPSLQDAVEAISADPDVPPVGIDTEAILTQLAGALWNARVAFRARRELEQATHGVPIETLCRLMAEAIQAKSREWIFEPFTKQTAETFRSEAEATLHGALCPLIGTEIDDLEVTVKSNEILRPVFHISYRLSRTRQMYTCIIEGAPGFD
jgi:hypothetical protein